MASIAPFKTDSAKQGPNPNRGKLTLLPIYQSGFSTATSLTLNPRQKQRIRRPKPQLGLCLLVFFFKQLQTEFVVASLFAHILAATHSHRVPTSNAELQIQLRNREKKEKGGGLHKRDLHNLFAQANYGLSFG